MSGNDERAIDGFDLKASKEHLGVARVNGDTMIRISTEEYRMLVSFAETLSALRRPAPERAVPDLVRIWCQRFDDKIERALFDRMIRDMFREWYGS